jgi:opacity protein-like surface antigen
MPLSKIFFAIFFLITPLLFAQNEKTESEKEKVNSLEKGSWSFQFQIAQYFQLSSFNGQTISFKYHLTESSAVRAGITLNGSYADNDNNQVDVSYDLALKNVSEKDEIGITISADYLFYLNPKNPINFFFGGGLLFGFSKSNSEDKNNDFRSDTLYQVRKNITDQTSNSYGLNLLAGVEWFVNSFISIHAEYYTQIYYSKNSRESKSVRTNLTDTTKDLIMTTENSNERFRIYPNGIKFGLSVYF